MFCLFCLPGFDFAHLCIAKYAKFYYDTMFQLIASLINIFAVTLRGAFSFASFVGQVIVTVLSGVASSVFNVMKSILLFFEIIYEDNAFIFTQELPSFTNNTITILTQQWKRVQMALNDISESASSKVHNTAVALTWSFQAASTIIFEVLTMIKKSIVFAGKTLWFLITFFPLLLHDILSYSKFILSEFLKSLNDVIFKVCNFLVDVPLESCIGLLIAVVIVRLCIEFRNEIQIHLQDLYWMCARKLLYIYHVVYNYATDSEARTITRLASGHDIGIIHDDLLEDEDSLDPAEALCVVCQERQKCVLILPCRHVCLCRECCVRLYGYQRTCPICRTFIYHSVTIYL